MLPSADLLSAARPHTALALRGAAANARLAALARCCKPSDWRDAFRKTAALIAMAGKTRGTVACTAC